MNTRKALLSALLLALLAAVPIAASAGDILIDVSGQLAGQR